MLKLDLKDRKILVELDKNARQSNSEIAKKVRLNKNTVTYKINRLEKEKAILSYFAVIDNSKLGYFSFRVYFKFFNTTAEKENEIIQWLIKNKQICIVAKSEGVYDLTIMMWVKTVYDFDDFWLEFKTKFRKYIWKENVTVFTKVYNFKRKYLLEEKKDDSYEVVGGTETAKYDELDLKIIRLLSKNARMPLVEIADILKTPVRTIAFRIQQMEKNKIIQGYRANLNYEAIGYEYYKINMVLDDYDVYHQLFEFAKMHPNVIYIDRTVSDLDFEIDVEIKSKKELYTLLDQIKKEFHVRDMEIFTIKEFYKLELMPQE